MTDGQQIALAIAPTVLPTLAVLIGILINNRQIDSVRSEIGSVRAETGSLRAEMRAGFMSVNREFELTRGNSLPKSCFGSKASWMRV